MRRFAELFQRLDETNKTSAKKQALVDYFNAAPAEDAAWAVAFLTGDRPKRVVPTKALVEAVCRRAQIPEWLFDECAEQAGDMSEALALLLPVNEAHTDPPSLTTMIETRLLPLNKLDNDAAVAAVEASWAMLNARERLVWNKLLGGSFRVGVAKGVVVQALAQVANVDTQAIAARLTGDVDKTAAGFKALVAKDGDVDNAAAFDPARPYPFYLASPIPGAHPKELGSVDDFVIEQKWDGIRAQLIVRDVEGEKKIWLWSRGEEEVSAAFPDVVAAARTLPAGTVLDGELLAWQSGVDDGGVRTFNDLQQRLNRKKPSAKLLEEIPVRLLTYDLLEEGGIDLRALPMRERRQRLEALAPPHGFVVSPLAKASTWEGLDELWHQSRAHGVEGLMLKRVESPYRAGRVRGDWWKWKVAPLSVDCVLVYAQKGSGRRAGLYSDYTFAVWNKAADADGDPRQLVTFAKAYSGLTDEELKKVDAFIKRHTTERFGPVRAVEPEIVVELGFEGIAESTRHKSGIAVRFPRILRLREDKKPADADTVDTLRALIGPPT